VGVDATLGSGTFSFLIKQLTGLLQTEHVPVAWFLLLDVSLISGSLIWVLVVSPFFFPLLQWKHNTSMVFGAGSVILGLSGIIKKGMSK